MTFFNLKWFDVYSFSIYHLQDKQRMEFYYCYNSRFVDETFILKRIITERKLIQKEIDEIKR